MNTVYIGFKVRLHAFVFVGWHTPQSAALNMLTDLPCGQGMAALAHMLC